jgi:poly(3-hydroxybutyrate) depolymerase
MPGLAASFATVGLLAFSAFAPALGAKLSPGCGKTSQINGNRTTVINDKERWYIVRRPENYDNSHPYRLIFTLHALSGNASQVVDGVGGYLPYYGLPPFTNDTTGAIFVAPNGLNNGWANTGGDDIRFIDDMIQTVEADLCVDQNLRFATGFSYGAGMSYSIACSRAKQFRAVAALSGAVLSGCEGGNDPIAYYGQHGIGDTGLPIERGQQMRDRFVKNNNCTVVTTAAPREGDGTMVKTEYKNCSSGYPVTWIAFDGAHTPQPRVKGENGTFSAVETWNFFKQFT